MVNADLLNKKIKDSGLKKGYIIQKMGLSPSGFLKKVKKNRFNTDEVGAFCAIVGITDDKEMCSIFFAKDVDKNGNILI